MVDVDNDVAGDDTPTASACKSAADTRRVIDANYLS
jgi:hypothetical protein